MSGVTSSMRGATCRIAVLVDHGGAYAFAKIVAGRTLRARRDIPAPGIPPASVMPAPARSSFSVTTIPRGDFSFSVFSVAQRQFGAIAYEVLRRCLPSGRA